MFVGHSLNKDNPPVIVPHIPKNRLLNENGDIARICVSRSLDGCLTAIGPAIIEIKTLLNSFQSRCSLEEMLEQEPNRIFEFYEKEIFFPFTILTFDVAENTTELRKTSLIARYVPDAWITQECWLMKETRPSFVHHHWLADGEIKRSNLLFEGKSFPYFTIENSVWKDYPCALSTHMQRDLVKVTFQYLLQQ